MRSSSGVTATGSTPPPITAPSRVFPLPLIRGTVAGRTVMDARTVHIADLQGEAEEFPESSENARRWGVRTILSVPLMREGIAIGVITPRRTEARLFTDRQVALLQTFADQAVIAIENVRLFKELEARNARADRGARPADGDQRDPARHPSSPTDIQPVLDTVAESAARLCEAFDASIFRLDGDRLLLVAHHGPISAGPVGAFTFPAGSRDDRWPNGAGRADRPCRGHAGRGRRSSPRAARTRGGWVSTPCSASP